MYLLTISVLVVMFVVWVIKTNKTQQTNKDHLAEIHARLKKVEEENKMGKY